MYRFFIVTEQMACRDKQSKMAEKVWVRLRVGFYLRITDVAQESAKITEHPQNSQ